MAVCVIEGFEEGVGFGHFGVRWERRCEGVRVNGRKMC